MAGNYPDVPGHRMAYDRDGSAGFEWTTDDNVISSLSNAELIKMTNDSDDSHDLAMLEDFQGYVAILFPEPRDLVGMLFRASVNAGGSPQSVETSADTTNGFDGTWTVQESWGYDDGDSTWSPADARTGILSINAPATTGVRCRARTDANFSGTLKIYEWHFYGTPSAGEAPNRLRFWHPTLDEEIDGAYFDWGDVARNTELFRDFRVKNPSATLTANTVSVTREALTDTTPSNVSQHDFSTDSGLTFDTSASVGNLAPGATSAIITLRRDTAATATLSLWWLRLVASASSWS